MAQLPISGGPQLFHNKSNGDRVEPDLPDTYPEGMPILQPRVARTRYPGSCHKIFYPERVASCAANG